MPPPERLPYFQRKRLRQSIKILYQNRWHLGIYLTSEKKRHFGSAVTYVPPPPPPRDSPWKEWNNTTLSPRPVCARACVSARLFTHFHTSCMLCVRPPPSVFSTRHSLLNLTDEGYEWGGGGMCCNPDPPRQKHTQIVWLSNRCRRAPVDHIFSP